MSRQVWWIRHGETEWNRGLRWQGHTDVPLSEHGREQVRRLGLRLQAERFDGVYSSDLQRAVESARLAWPQGPWVSEPRLREVHFGIFEGRRRDQLEPAEVEQLEAWLAAPFERRAPGGESLGELAARVEEWLEHLPSRGRFAVFTHGGVIRTMLWRIMGAPRDNRWTLQIHNASISCVDYGRRTSIEWVNDYAHLR